MEKFILVPYKLLGVPGKVMVREGTPEEEIRKICVIDTKAEEIESWAKEVEIGGENGI